MKPYVVGVIFARGGSKGIPHKNIRPLMGKPLLGYAIETAQGCKSIDRVVVSTDDEEIANLARKHGAEVPFMRPAELARDDTPELLAWQHAIRTLQTKPGARPIDVLVSIPTTSPLRVVEDVEACVASLLGSDADIVITMTQASRSPYFNMVVVNEQGYVQTAIKPSKPVYRRQEAPVVYDMTTVAYAARADFVLRTSRLFDGKVKGVLIPPERAIDIDSELDFRFAEFLLSQGLVRSPTIKN